VGHRPAPVRHHQVLRVVRDALPRDDLVGGGDRGGLELLRVCGCAGQQVDHVVPGAAGEGGQELRAVCGRDAQVPRVDTGGRPVEDPGVGDGARRGIDVGGQLDCHGDRGGEERVQ